jgi:hypothetical protein
MTDSLARRLLCPNESEPGHGGMTEYELIVRRQSRGGRFRCTSCGLVFMVSDAGVRRLMVRRMVLE